MATDGWYLRTLDDTFGPETKERLIEWAKLGRIQPGQDISCDGENWVPATEVPFLDMRWSIDIGDGTPRGPFNKTAAEALLRSGRLPKGSRLVEVRPAIEEPAPQHAITPVQVATREESSPRVIEKIVEKRVEVPVEKIVEKRIEVPVERIIEKKVEVPDPRQAAKIAELVAQREVQEGVMKDLRARISELESNAAEAKSDATEAKSRMEEAESRRAEAEARAASTEDEMRRMPANARLAADAEAAIYALMSSESEEVAKALEDEKRDFEERRKLCQKRMDRLLARRQELLKRIGTGIEDMTRRALRAHPEDPRAVQSRRELDEMKLASEQRAREAEQTIRDLTRKCAEQKAELDRLRTQVADSTVLVNQMQELRERLQLRERELRVERQAAETARQRSTDAQQALLARLAQLESNLPGGTQQSRDARNVRLAPWMGLKQ